MVEQSLRVDRPPGISYHPFPSRMALRLRPALKFSQPVLFVYLRLINRKFLLMLKLDIAPGAIGNAPCTRNSIARSLPSFSSRKEGSVNHPPAKTLVQLAQPPLSPIPLVSTSLATLWQGSYFGGLAVERILKFLRYRTKSQLERTV